MILSFIGKGGVGKTSIASAFALELASLGRAIIVSTDFMPSLRYIFNQSDKLEYVELSEKEVSSKWIARYGDEVLSIVSEFMDTDRSILEHIASAPGVAEEFMISNVVDIDESGNYDFVIWDTPASSSTMHLLNLEKDFYNHIGRDIQFYLKLKQRLGGKKAIETLIKWRELADHVWKRLERTHFIMVTTMDDLSLIQSDEIRGDFKKMGLPIDIMICNRVRDQCTRNSGCSALISEYSGNGREIVESIRKNAGHEIRSILRGLT
ncbi:MAG: ArsA-related P-loop ATPase [Thermoplasmataceae archaeon]